MDAMLKAVLQEKLEAIEQEVRDIRALGEKEKLSSEEVQRMYGRVIDLHCDADLVRRNFESWLRSPR
jgi:hypothetical protein